MNAFRGSVTRALIALAVLMSLTGVLWAQGGTGELTGLVTDASGAVVPNATVVLMNSATGEKRNETTTSAGTYRFAALQVVGTYSLHITAKGFRGYQIADIIITTGTVTAENAKLEVGAAGETVTVEAGAQLVQTTESSLSDVVNSRVWQSMPLETRSQNEFIGLLAGAEPASNAMLGTDRGAAVNGARSGTGNFLVEGFDNNDQGLGGGGSSVGPGGANTTISPDAIQEYTVIEHLPNAEYGKAGGFVTDTVLKSGTNQWHGSLFEYNRIQEFAANSWFSDQAHEQDHLVRNQFGGSIGGPIVKDHSFFFFTIEEHRARSSSPLTADTLTTDFVNFVNSGAFEQFQEGTGPYATAVADPAGNVDALGLCRAFSATVGNPNGNPCPGAFSASSTLGPIFSAMQNIQNLPFCTPGSSNCPTSSLSYVGQGLFTGGLNYPVNMYGTVSVSQPTVLNQTRYTAKFDQKLTAKDQLNAAFLYDNADSTTAYAGGDSSLGPTLFDHVRAQNFGVTWSHTFSPTVLNQARVAYVRHTANFPGSPIVAGYPSVVTAFDETTLAYGNSSGLPQFFTENEFVYKDDLSVTHGKHNFKGGGEYRRTRNGSSFDADENGFFLPYSSEDMLTDLKFDDEADILLNGAPTYGSVYFAEASVNPTTDQLPVFYRGYRANEAAMYIQDSWRTTPRLTLNLGLRWEYFGPPHNYQPNLDSNFYTGAPTTPFVVDDPGTCTPGPCVPDSNPFLPVTNAFYAGVASGTTQIKNHDIWNKDLTNFGPRIGFAYDVSGRGKLVIRGGYGINYDRMYNNIFENIRFNPPYFAFSELGKFGNGVPVGGLETPGVYTAPFTSTSLFGGVNLAPSLRAVDQNLTTAYYEQANLGFQYELAKDFVLETNYVGTFGHRLLGIVGANTFDGRYAAGLDNTAVNPTYSSISFRTNCCTSNYNGVQFTVRKRFSSGLQFNANYTYSKAMDEISDAFSTKNASTAAYPTDSTNPYFDYGPADFDVRQRLVFSYNYDLPFARGNRWLGGWSLSGILSVQTGSPFSVGDSCGACDSNQDGQFNDRAAWLGGGSVTSDVDHSVSPATGYLKNSGWGMPGVIPNSGQPNLTADPCPASINSGLWCEGPAVGQMRRNSLYGPHYANLDFGVAKAFRITENTKVTLLGNFFNLFNHPNFSNPDSDLNDATFGQSLSTFAPGPGGARVTQLALRFDF